MFSRARYLLRWWRWFLSYPSVADRYYWPGDPWYEHGKTKYSRETRNILLKRWMDKEPQP